LLGVYYSYEIIVSGPWIVMSRFEVWFSYHLLISSKLTSLQFEDR